MLTALGEEVVKDHGGHRPSVVQDAILMIVKAAEQFVDAAPANSDYSAEIDALEFSVRCYRQAIGYKPPPVAPQSAKSAVSPMKTCRKCGQEFPLETFPEAVAGGRLYRRGWCQSCLRNYFREFRRKKAALARETNRCV